MRQTAEQEILLAMGVPTWPSRWRGLVPVPDAQQLTIVGRSPFGRIVWLQLEAAKAWSAMSVAARQDGVALLPVSGFRSRQRQAELVVAKLRRGHSIAQILSVSALPGFSEHQSGRAIDLACDMATALDQVFEQTNAYAWLLQHAENFGFRLSYPRNNVSGFEFEPWHWCWSAGSG